VSDILDLSKIEAGEIPVVQEVYEIPSLVNDVPQLHIVYQGSKSIELVLSVDKATPARLIGDSLRIEQVINNLLSNAFKYTLKGTVQKRIPQTDKLIRLIENFEFSKAKKMLAKVRQNLGV